MSSHACMLCAPPVSASSVNSHMFLRWQLLTSMWLTQASYPRPCAGSGACRWLAPRWRRQSRWSGGRMGIGEACSELRQLLASASESLSSQRRSRVCPRIWFAIHSRRNPRVLALLPVPSGRVFPVNGRRRTGRSEQGSHVGMRAHPDLNQGPADLQSAALTTGLCTHWCVLLLTALCADACSNASKNEI